MSFSPDEVERYARHLVLREIGGPGQQRLRAARVLIVGLGGLGAPAALYLAAAGIGRLGLIDPDQVGLSNLQRQILYRTADIGKDKVEVASERLAAQNPQVEIVAYSTRFEAQTWREGVKDYDLVLDGTDNFATRFAINAACLAAKKPLISGALGRWTGQVALFEPSGRPCYRCLVPDIPPDAETCSAVGVVGALSGVIGAMMALEAIKYLCGTEPSFAGRLLIYDGLSAQARTVRILPDPSCPACGSPLLA